jgi:hypothetical protein
VAQFAEDVLIIQFIVKESNFCGGFASGKMRETPG